MVKFPGTEVRKTGFRRLDFMQQKIRMSEGEKRKEFAGVLNKSAARKRQGMEKSMIIKNQKLPACTE